MNLEEDYFYRKYVEESYMAEDLGKNPIPDWLDNLYAQHQMQKDYHWVVQELRKLNSHIKNTKRMNTK